MSSSSDLARHNKIKTVPVKERIQFSDGRVAFGFRTLGDRVEWDQHGYTRHLGVPQGPGLAIVGTESGRRFAVGSGVAVMLPDFLEEEGRFKSDSKELVAKSVAEGLPDVTLGEPWELLGDEDRITDVIVDYTNMPTGLGEAHQLDMPNPFDSAKDIVNDIAARMETAGRLHQS